MRRRIFCGCVSSEYALMRLSMLPLVIAVLYLGNTAIAQDKSDASRILALENEWNSAYRRGDVARMGILLADDFIITVEDGRTLSKLGYIALNGNSTVRVEISEMSDMKVRMQGNTVAVVTGAYHEKGTSQAKPYEYNDRFTDVWMKIEGRWQVIASHYSIPIRE
jgi:ketosteroid isomerase-like protein